MSIVKDGVYSNDLRSGSAIAGVLSGSSSAPGATVTDDFATNSTDYTGPTD
ncbi:hypothetical protein [Microvirga antarctica]|uniref:hypothetical protein n=1 Tax=Microvirga antarctica TaxID=2819233 RepID=UPI001B301832|nr:hypothetical protein [Microvirga antarctica]